MVNSVQRRGLNAALL